MKYISKYSGIAVCLILLIAATLGLTWCAGAFLSVYAQVFKSGWHHTERQLQIESTR